MRLPSASFLFSLCRTPCDLTNLFSCSSRSQCLTNSLTGPATGPTRGKHIHDPHLPFRERSPIRSGHVPAPPIDRFGGAG